jgi:hypothetical protein
LTRKRLCNSIGSYFFSSSPLNQPDFSSFQNIFIRVPGWAKVNAFQNLRIKSMFFFCPKNPPAKCWKIPKHKNTKFQLSLKSARMKTRVDTYVSTMVINYAVFLLNPSLVSNWKFWWLILGTTNYQFFSLRDGIPLNSDHPNIYYSYFSLGF